MTTPGRRRSAPPPASGDDEPTAVKQPAFDKKKAMSQTLPLGTPAEAPRQRRPAIEVDVRAVKTVDAVSAATQRAYEIWTLNRVYRVNTQMICSEVIDLATGAVDNRHPFLGARLVGGQLSRSKGNELTFPLPLPGSDAVFQKTDRNGRIRLSVTSKVTRVILQIQQVSVDESNERTWDTITNHGR